MRNTTLFVAIAAAALVFCPAPSEQQVSDSTNSTGCDASSRIAGYFEGTATSRQDGVLKVALNLRCHEGHFAGEFITPVGKFEVISGTLQGSKLVLTFVAGEDKGTLEADLVVEKLHGHFTFGDDSGPVELMRAGDAKQPGFDKPILDLTPAQWREDLKYFATELPKQHANAFYHLSKEEFAAAVANADRELGYANGDAAYVAIDRIANAIGDGHTFVIWPDDLAHFPLSIRMFEGVYRIAGVQQGTSGPWGLAS